MKKSTSSVNVAEVKCDYIKTVRRHSVVLKENNFEKNKHIESSKRNIPQCPNCGSANVKRYLQWKEQYQLEC